MYKSYVTANCNKMTRTQHIYYRSEPQSVRFRIRSCPSL